MSPSATRASRSAFAPFFANPRVFISAMLAPHLEQTA